MKNVVMVECKKHSATIPERTCYLRFGEIKYYTGKNLHKFDGCKGCKIGSEIYERLFGQKDTKPSRILNQDKKCTVCKKSMGASMFGNKGKNNVCIECEGNNAYSEKEQPKSISIKHCSRCKKHYPKDDFYKNKTKGDGLSDWCKECTKKKNKQYEKSKKKHREIKMPKVKHEIKKEKSEPKEEEKTSDDVIMIDFSLHKDLLKRLMKKAENEFRTVEQQILFDCNALTK